MLASMSSWGIPGQLTRMVACVTPARCWARSASIDLRGRADGEAICGEAPQLVFGQRGGIEVTPASPQDR